MMQVHTDISQLPAFRNAVITIGTFDGVHLGHRQIIDHLRSTAAGIDGESVIITFHPHPRVVVGSTQRMDLLTTMYERITLLGEQGVDHLVIIPFTEAFAAMPAAEYVEKFLVDHFHPKVLIIGYDHRFGKGRLGDYHLLEDLSARFGYAVREIPEQLLHESAVSSTRIRERLRSGDIAEANAGLGYPYFLEGTVVHGDQRGRTIGFPTANLQMNEPDKLVPADGVYVVSASLTGTDGVVMQLNGMMNIGLRPTVDGKRRSIEVNLFHFDADIYGSTMRVWFHHRLRDEKRFDSLDALKDQLAEDGRKARELLGL